MTTSLRAYLKVGVSCSISVVLYLSMMFLLSSKYLGFPVGLYNLFLKKKIMLYISYHLSTKDLRISLSLSHNRILTKTYKNLTITVLLTMSIAYIFKQFCDNFFSCALLSWMLSLFNSKFKYISSMILFQK